MPLTTDTDNYQKEIHPIDSNVYKSFTRHNKILVLCIDRDDDIGSKGSIETPIVGRDSCIDAGIRLAMEDPEDSDVNAIFAAIKSYEELLSKGYDSEVAVVAGKFNRGIEADEKIGLEIDGILNKFKADAAVIVSDYYKTK
jgi:putative membrane protein